VLLNQAKLFNQPEPASQCQKGTAPLQLCRGGGQTGNSKVIFGGRSEKTTIVVAFPVAQESPFNYFFFILCHIVSELQKTLSAG